jgi:hypothetical protein
VIAFLLGVGLACAAATALPGLAEVLLFENTGWFANRPVLWSLVWIGVAQMLAAGLCADMMHALRPRAMFLRGRFTTRALVLGLIVGGLGNVWLIVAAVIAFPWYDPISLLEPIAAAALMGGACVLVLGLCPRRKPGTCAGCGYDLVLLTPSSKGKCPECGRDHFRVE